MFLAAEIAGESRATLTWRYPVIVSSAFGVLHGFGFASALRDIGLPQTEAPLALVAFNLGIEAGQLLFVAACLALWHVAGRVGTWLTRPRIMASPLRARPLAYAIGSVAAFWFV